MKRRLMIARAMMNEPRLLILDEPTAGVDIEIRRSMWDFLREINARGTTIILTTHYLEEAETLCRNIAIINGGRIIARERMSTSCVACTLRPSCSTCAMPSHRRRRSRVTHCDSSTITPWRSRSPRMTTSTSLRAPLGTGHRGAEHAQQGESPGRDLHAPGRGAWRHKRGCYDTGGGRRAAVRTRGGNSVAAAVPKVNLNVVVGSASRPSSSASTAASCASGDRLSCPRW